MRRIDEIIIHCSATPAGKSFDLNDITRWHLERGFKSCGYHYIILLDGTLQLGRPLSEIGAHCLGHNSHSIGVCYIGGLDSHGSPCDTRTKAQISTMVSLISSLLIDFPGASVHGHNEFSSKSCPCFDVKSFVLKYL